MKYRSRTTVEVIQWTGENSEEVEAFCLSLKDGINVRSLRASLMLEREDWVVIEGCSRSIYSSEEFESCYEPLPEPTP